MRGSSQSSHKSINKSVTSSQNNYTYLPKQIRRRIMSILKEKGLENAFLTFLIRQDEKYSHAVFPFLYYFLKIQKVDPKWVYKNLGGDNLKKYLEKRISEQENDDDDANWNMELNRLKNYLQLFKLCILNYPRSLDLKIIQKIINSLYQKQKGTIAKKLLVKLAVLQDNLDKMPQQPLRLLSTPQKSANLYEFRPARQYYDQPEKNHRSTFISSSFQSQRIQQSNEYDQLSLQNDLVAVQNAIDQKLDYINFNLRQLRYLKIGDICRCNPKSTLSILDLIFQLVSDRIGDQKLIETLKRQGRTSLREQQSYDKRQLVMISRKKLDELRDQLDHSNKARNGLLALQIQKNQNSEDFPEQNPSIEQKRAKEIIEIAQQKAKQIIVNTQQKCKEIQQIWSQWVNEHVQIMDDLYYQQKELLEMIKSGRLPLTNPIKQQEKKEEEIIVQNQKLKEARRIADELSDGLQKNLNLFTANLIKVSKFTQKYKDHENLILVELKENQESNNGNGLDGSLQKVEEEFVGK